MAEEKESGELERLRSQVSVLEKELQSLKVSNSRPKMKMTAEVVDSNPYRSVFFITLYNIYIYTPRLKFLCDFGDFCLLSDIVVR